MYEKFYTKMKKMQKWKCKVLLQWGKDFHYFIILYLNHLWTLDGQPLEISLPLNNQGLFAGYPWIYLAPRNIKTLERTRECTAGRSWKIPGPEIIQVLEKTRDCTAGRSWKYPGSGKSQGAPLGAPLNFPGGIFLFLIGDWLANLVWILEEKIYLNGIL